MAKPSTLWYALVLAWGGLCRFGKSTLLVVATVALGIAACMTTLTVLHVLAADPLPGRSQNLYLVWVDTIMGRPYSLAGCLASNAPSCNSTFDQVKLDAAKALSATGPATRGTVVADMLANEVSGNGLRADNQQQVLATTSAFMPMFGVRLRYGRDWTRAEDTAHDPVAVIDTRLARRLFGTVDAVGRSVRLGQTLFRVVGVMQPFEPEPHFYALVGGAFGVAENMYVPYTAALDAGLQPESSDDCDTGYKSPRGRMGTDPTHCASLSAWVQLDNPRQVTAYRSFLRNYVDQYRKALALWGKVPSFRLTGVGRWLEQNHVVPDTARLDVWLAVAFLALCMLNVIGLLSARFLRRSREIGIRRALGAPRHAVFLRHVIEAGLMCVAGGLLAIPLTLVGLWILRGQGNHLARLANLDPAMFGALAAISIVVGALVGLPSAWRAAVTEPGLQVKSE